MSIKGKGNEAFWERFKSWEEEWKKKRMENRLDDARKLREAEDDYERSLRSLNPLESPPPEPKEILGVKSNEPALKKLPLKAISSLPLILPVELLRVELQGKELGQIFFRAEEEESANLLYSLAFNIKRLIEYILDERLLFIIQPKDRDSFFIKAAWDSKSPPFFEVALSSPELIHIKVLEHHIAWSHGFIFDCKDILEMIVQRLRKEITLI